MVKELFGPMELDALGEMMNISLGSSATAVSNMLEHRVDITTPKVSVVEVSNFQIGNLDPAMGVEIKYVEGLDGSNIMLLRKSDVKVIVDILMGSETPDEEFELNELTISAVCEVMNQMMGAAATAMSDFLGFPVNISTPEPFDLEDLERFKRNHLPQGAETIVIVRFSLRIENALESEFMNVMSVELAKELLKGLGLGEDDFFDETPAPAPAPASSGGGQVMSQEEIERMMSGMAGGADPAPAPAPSGGGQVMSQEEIERMLSGMGGGAAPAPAPASSGGGQVMGQEEIERMMSGMAGSSAPAPAPQAQPQMPPQMQVPPQAQSQMPPQMQMPPQGQPQMQMPPQMPYGYPPMEGNPYGYMGYPPMYYGYPPYPPQQPAAQVEPKVIETKPLEMKEMQGAASLGKEQSENLELIMEVPLQVTVEIGRTQRKVQDILEFSKGSLVVLDKLAGDQVDLFVNGKCIAKGDVVVIDDNFGVRITEIIQKNGMDALVMKK